VHPPFLLFLLLLELLLFLLLLLLLLPMLLLLLLLLLLLPWTSTPTVEMLWLAPPHLFPPVAWMPTPFSGSTL